MTLGEWLREAEARLSEAGIESARIEAQVLAGHALDKPREWILAHPEVEVSPNESALETLLNRRLKHEPMAYILGYREFYGRRFIIRPGVLIPRQETEVLVETALDRLGKPFRVRGYAALLAQAKPQLRDEEDDKKRILEIGVGSGIICVTLKLERPNCRIVGTDISAAAIGVAKKNTREFDVEVSLYEADHFPPESVPPFDLIVSNPPYVRERDCIGKDVRFEPREALFAGDDGLDVYRRLASEAARWLTRTGEILLEVGAGQATDVIVLFESAGWCHTETRKDLSGHERVVGFAPPTDIAPAGRANRRPQGF